MSEKDFWTMFFQSHYFHRDRINQGNSSKDIFSDCVKKDDLGKKLLFLQKKTNHYRVMLACDIIYRSVIVS